MTADLSRRPPSERAKAAAKQLTRSAVTLDPHRANDLARLVLLAADKADRAAGVVRVSVDELCDFCAREIFG